MTLLTIDSRDRENDANTDRTKIHIKFERPLTFQSISLIFMDFPFQFDETDLESMYFINIEELPNNVRGSTFSDIASFIHIRSAPSNARSVSFENQHFTQTITLNKPTVFEGFHITIRYRSKSTEALQIPSDYSCIFRTA